MTYPDFVKELTDRFGEDQGVLMALRAEVGFLRKYLEAQGGDEFVQKQEEMIEDFLKRHPKQ
jgi:hypothetical protein